MSRMFPAWSLPEPGRNDAVKTRLPLALKELRALYVAMNRDPKEYIGREEKSIHVALLEQVLRNPAHHWTRHIRHGKQGDKRICFAPSKDLAQLQNNLAFAMFWSTLHLPFGGMVSPYFPATAYGYECSIVANARHHRHCRSSFRVDIANAFGSISTNRIAGFLVNHGIGKNLAWVASRVFTFQGKLEQGSSIAPHLFNIMLRQLDEALGDATGADVEDARIEQLTLLLAKSDRSFNATRIDGRFVHCPPGDARFPAATRPIVYTRYGDDCCFSFRGDVFPKELETVIEATIEAHGFRVNRKKTRRANNGNVDLPGVYIKEGRIRPNGAYVRKLKGLVNDGTILPTFGDEANKAAYRRRLGHIAFIAQFGHGGRLKIFRSGTLHGLRFDTGRTLKDRQRKKAHEDQLTAKRERAERAANGIPERDMYS